MVVAGSFNHGLERRLTAAGISAAESTPVLAERGRLAAIETSDPRVRRTSAFLVSVYRQDEAGRLDEVETRVASDEASALIAGELACRKHGVAFVLRETGRRRGASATAIIKSFGLEGHPDY